MVVSDFSEQLGELCIPGRPDVSHGVFEPRSQAREGVKQPVGICVMAGLPHGAERGLPDETRRVQATGLGSRCDAGELVGVEAEKLGCGTAARGRQWMLPGSGSLRWTPST